MSDPVVGGCLCGAVRYQITTEPMFGGKCYCNDCRKASSTGHAAVMAVPEDGFSVSGALTGYERAGGSGQPITRHFCTTCGSPIYSEPTAMPGVVMVRASTLDKPEGFASQMSVFAASAPSWDRPPEGTVMFDTMPPADS